MKDQSLGNVLHHTKNAETLRIEFSQRHSEVSSMSMGTVTPQLPLGIFKSSLGQAFALFDRAKQNPICFRKWGF
ncbi:hypothetical protein, partial [Pseudomonas grimontii]|uniref:hypothetical protein n=1 Tax=Pseudomonas grimontii TaxID=129847 RepID=UPI0028EA1BC7